MLWKHHFDTTFSPPPGVSFGTLCPGGQLATPVIGPGKTPGSYIIYAAAWDGRLHQLDVATGKAVAPSELFMPPNGKPYGLNLWNNVVYTTSAQGCGGNPNYVYAFDLATRRTATFDPGSGGMWGRSGPSIGKDGTMYTGTGDGSYNPELRSYGTAVIGVKLDPKTGALKLKDYFGPPNAEYLLKRDMDLQVTGPVFEHAGREWLVQASKECRTWLLDTSALGGEDHSTAEHRSPLICNEDQDYQAAGVYGAMATYEDAKGTRWVLVPFWGPKHPKFKAPIEHGEVFNGAVAAFRMEKNPATGQLLPESGVDLARHEACRPVRSSRTASCSASPAAKTSCCDRRRCRLAVRRKTAARRGRIARSTHSVLYALDGQTGQELWSSGDTITSWNHYSGISVANGRVYIGTLRRHRLLFRAAAMKKTVCLDRDRLRVGDERSPLRAGAQRTRLDDAGVRCAAHVVDARRSVHLDRTPVEVSVSLEAEGRQRVAARQRADRAGGARQPDDVSRIQVADLRRRQLEQRVRHRLRLRHDVLANASQLRGRRARIRRIADVSGRHDAAADARDTSDAADAARVLRVRAAAASGEGGRRRTWERRTAARGNRGAYRIARQSWRG